MLVIKAITGLDDSSAHRRRNHGTDPLRENNGVAVGKTEMIDGPANGSSRLSGIECNV